MHKTHLFIYYEWRESWLSCMVSYKSYITLLKILIVGMRSRCQSSHADNYPPPKTPSNGRLLTELDHGVTKEGWPGSCTTNQHTHNIFFLSAFSWSNIDSQAKQSQDGCYQFDKLTRGLLVQLQTSSPEKGGIGRIWQVTTMDKSTNSRAASLTREEKLYLILVMGKVVYSS